MSAALENILDNFQQRRPLRAGSLIITIYGDTLMPRGGEVWLGSLINILEPFGLNPRLTRTAVFRLTQDEWLSAKPIGRRSYYQVTETGRASFTQAFKRIYAHASPDWNGEWSIAMLTMLDNEERKNLRQKLSWLGYGQIGPQTMMHPSNNTTDVEKLLRKLDLQDKVMLISGLNDGDKVTPAMMEQIKACWDLKSLGEDYQQFLDLFRPLLQDISNQPLTDEQAFQARTLLIHEYRRIMLKDPFLPDELLCTHWNGRAARQLCANLYQLLWQSAERYISTQLETADGPLPPVNNKFMRRFGGLGSDSRV